jgi:hypothetical protein
MLYMQKIHFTVFSQAYYVDMKWGYGCPSGGIRNMGSIFHKYKIPVTWLVSPQSARCEIEMFTEFHEKYGDEIALMFRFNQKESANERDVASKMTVEQCRNEVRKQKQEIQKSLPWADIKVAGQGIRTANLLTALQQEGFIGMFGHCYCQIGTDSITDYGMPWGSFPLRQGDAHQPSRETDQDGMLTFEWTMRDLNRSFHTVRPELWSTDPNDVERGGVCTDTDVEWWKNMYMQYERALPYNEHGIWFQFHQEAHEQTWGEVCHPFTEERVIFCTKMMDKFLQWLVTRDTVNFLTPTKAVELYKKAKAKGTIPMYVPYAWTSVPDYLPFWDQIRARTKYSGSISKHAHLPIESLFDYLGKVNNGDPMVAMKSPPWMDSFFYFDGECQLVFDKGKINPIVLFNYLNFEPDPDIVDIKEMGGGMPGFFLEEEIPTCKIELQKEDINIKTMNLKDKELPYGVFFWSELYPQIKTIIQKKKLERSLKVKTIPDQGVFIRFNVGPGETIMKL